MDGPLETFLKPLYDKTNLYNSETPTEIMSSLFCLDPQNNEVVLCMIMLMGFRILQMYFLINYSFHLPIGKFIFS